MAFWDILEKGFGIGMEFLGELANYEGKRIDRMSDEEIEKQFNKSADAVRNNFDQARMAYDRYKMSRDMQDTENE